MTTPQINLLPSDYRPPKSGVLLPHYVAAGAVVAALLLGGGAYYWSLAAERSMLAARLPDLEQEQAQVKTALQRAAHLKEREDKAGQVEASMQGLRGRVWWPVLLSFQELTPTGLTWEVVEGDSNRVRLKGRAANMAEVAQFVTGLAGSSLVEGVDLRQARLNDKGRFDLELTVRLVPEGGKA